MLGFMRLGAEQGRVIGSLIEKQLTTPQQYPLSLNALVQACNQLSNRDPIVSYDERVVDETLVSLKEAGLVRFVHPSHGRSVTRYRQVLEERLGLDDQQLALVAVLPLARPADRRGAAGPHGTDGDLRWHQHPGGRTGPPGRVARAVGGPLGAPCGSEGGTLDPAAHGRRPDRRHRAGRGAWGAGLSRPAASEPPAFAPTVPEAPASSAATGEVAGPDVEVVWLREEVADLRSEVADLRGEVIDLRTALEDLQTRLGGL